MTRSNKSKTGTKAQGFLYPDHKLPVTRRELLAAGLIESILCISKPSLFNLFQSQNVYGATLLDSIPHILCMFGEGGPGSWGSFVPGLLTNGSLIPTATQVERGVVANLSNPGELISRHGAPLVYSNPLTVSFFEPNATNAIARLGSPTLYAWNGVQNPDGIIGKTSVIARFGPTADDQSGAAAKLSPSSAIAQFFKDRLSNNPITGGVSLTDKVNFNLGLTTGVGTQSVDLSAPGNTPHFLQIDNGIQSILKAIGNPATALNNNQAISLFTRLSELTGTFKVKDLGRSLGGVPELIQQSSNLTLDPAQVFGADTNTLLNSLPLNLATNLGTALSAAFQGYSLPLVCFTQTGGDHHNGANYHANALNYAAITAKVMATFLTACASKNRKGIICLFPAGAMRGYTGADPDTGFAAGANSDDGRNTVTHLVYFNPQGVTLPQVPIFGSTSPVTGFADSPSTQNQAEVPLWLLSNIFSLTSGPDAVSSLLSTYVDNRAFSGDPRRFLAWT